MEKDKSEKKAVKKAAKKAVKKQMKKHAGRHAAAANSSNYLATIMDPVNCPGVKIPDDVTTPSFTVQTLTKVVVSANAGAGGNTGCGFVANLGSTGAGGNNSATLQAGAVANQYVPTGFSPAWQAGFVNQSAAQRLVSAKLTASYLSSPLNATGRMLGGFCPPGNTALGQANVNQSLTNLIQNLPALVDLPASKGYMECRYIPMDPIARSYEVSGSSAVAGLRGPASANLATYGFIGVIVDGVPAGAQVEFNLWQNWEVLAASNINNLAQPTCSHSDPIEMASVGNLLSSAPTASALQNPAEAITGTATTTAGGNAATRVTQAPEDEPFMDRMLRGAGQMVDYAQRAAPIVSSLLALI